MKQNLTEQINRGLTWLTTSSEVFVVPMKIIHQEDSNIKFVSFWDQVSEETIMIHVVN